MLTPICAFGWGAFHDMDHDAAERHFEKAREFKKQGKWVEARTEYEAAFALHDGTYYLLGIAECCDRLGEYDRAIELYDRSIARSNGWYQPYFDKASCIERNHGEDAVNAWYGELEQKEGDVAKYRYLLANHHMDHGRPGKALPCFHQALALTMRTQRVEFTDDDELAPLERIRVMEQNDLASMWPTVTYIAQCYYRTGDKDKAYRWATRGVSLHQHLCRVTGYCTAAQIEAGDTACRLLRARIHMDRREWDAAQAEIGHAKSFDDLWSENRCDEAQRSLDRSRPR